METDTAQKDLAPATKQYELTGLGQKWHRISLGGSQERMIYAGHSKCGIA